MGAELTRALTFRAMSTPPSNASRYPNVSPRADFPAIEKAILDRWAAEETFEKSVENRPSDNEYVFYDGPPFANGLPHYGHLLTGYVKDVIPRYQTMRGKRVERRFGWDCHGLPAEMQSEKQLGVSGRAAITEYGVDRFNEFCRSSVLEFTQEWERYVTRQARWVDFDNDYKTMDLSFMESVIWAFKQLWDKGLIYEAYRVMPYSWGAETPLSNFEIRLDDATRPRQDPALTVKFTLDPRPGDPGPLTALAWTTTPWTLPSNQALIVGDDIDYDVVRVGEEYFVLGSETRPGYDRELGEGELVATMKGADLVGRTYMPLFDYFADRADSFRVLSDGFVGTGDGTGIVHAAPGFGEDDQRVCEANGIGLVVPVDDSGRYTAAVSDWEGVNVFDANPSIIGHLKERGQLLRQATYDHNYPHCWRTDTPIIYRAVSSWFVRVSELSDRLQQLNQEINWIPSHVRDGQFGKWLEGARDWSISRNRFWGSPIPVWRSTDPAYPRVDVYGSLDEIEADFGVRPTDLHRPYIDELTRPNPDDPTGASMMVRDSSVFDCWFESGSMPFAQVHYPFDNREWFDTHSPADFIVEYIAQTRGWFYTLHVLSGALFDRPAFKNVICHGVVLDAEGRKLSKKVRNYADPEEVMGAIGSDALRWYLMSSPIVRGGDLRISTDAHEVKDVVRLVLNPLWNAYSFFATYANIDGVEAQISLDSPEPLDRYILAKTAEFATATTTSLDLYDIPGACNQFVSYLDALTNWYIRRSRDRFWAPASGAGSNPQDKVHAYNTLFTVLSTVCRVVAPLLPLVAEEIYTGLHGDRSAEGSVHLTDWPTPAELAADADLVNAMDRVRAACSTALNPREERKLRPRLPLQELVVAGLGADDLEPFAESIASELNVKQVRFSADAAEYGVEVLRPNAKVLGPRIGKDVQRVIKAAKSGDWTADGVDVIVDGVRLGPGEFETVLIPTEGTAAAAVRLLDPEGRIEDLGLGVALDITITAALAAEGYARDLIRLIQSTRKSEDLHPTDRIRVVADVPQPLVEPLMQFAEEIKAQTLATELRFGANSGAVAGKLADVEVAVAVEVAS